MNKVFVRRIVCKCRCVFAVKCNDKLCNILFFFKGFFYRLELRFENTERVLVYRSKLDRFNSGKSACNDFSIVVLAYSLVSERVEFINQALSNLILCKVRTEIRKLGKLIINRGASVNFCLKSRGQCRAKLVILRKEGKEIVRRWVYGSLNKISVSRSKSRLELFKTGSLINTCKLCRHIGNAARINRGRCGRGVGLFLNLLDKIVNYLTLFKVIVV